jgi:membrane-bound lytic murein transglycosylase A
MLLRLLLISAFTMSACLAAQPKASNDASLRVHDLPGWENEDHLPALKAFVHSCKRFTALPDTQLVHSNRSEFGTAKSWKKVCDKAASINDSEQAKTFFETDFTPRRVQGDGVFTGYYVIGLNGSLTPSERYRYPVYGTPPQEYLSLTRQEIDSGALIGKAKVLVWLDDPVELFFLHVQGSGIISFEDGSSQMIAFDSKTNHPYYSIGAYMTHQNLLPKDQISTKTIKQWLYDNPDKMNTVLWQNPSYIFFTFREKKLAIGGEGVPLTPNHSLAIDKAHLPYGVPLWVNTTLSATDSPWQRLMIAQDTGSAIKGKVRGDIFFGAGNDAEEYAGLQSSRGQYYTLLPKIR